MIAEPTEAQADAMEALFAFAEAFNGDMSAADLAEVMDFAIADGLEMFEIQLSMALRAVEEVKRRRAQRQ